MKIAKMTLALGAGCVGFAGCATSSGVLPMGGGAYTVTNSASLGAGGATAAKRNAYTEAAQQCERVHRTLHVLTETPVAPTWTDGLYHNTITFECT